MNEAHGKYCKGSGSSVAGYASACDPALHEQLVRPWDLCLTPLERGDFVYEMRYLKLPGIVLYRECYDLRCRLLGVSPAETLVFAVPLFKTSRSTFWGTSLSKSGMPAMLPGGLDVDFRKGHTQVIILIESTLIQTYLDSMQAERLEMAAKSRFLPASCDAVRSLGCFLSELIDQAIETAAITENTRAMKSIAEDLIDRLVRTVIVTSENTCRPTLSRRRKGLDRALEYLRNAKLDNQTIPEISHAAGVSQRTLEYAFRDAFGLTPLGFLKLQKMHAARQDLLRSSPKGNTVMQIAYRHGFYHPARFAMNYRRTFGERPSATLMRTVRNGNHNLSPLL